MAIRTAADGTIKRDPLAPYAASIDRAQLLLLSYAQQRVWFLDQLEPGRALYNIYNIFTALRLAGLLNLAAMLRALNGVVQRHELIRTAFRMIDGNAVQAIACLFDLAAGPLIRAKLLCLSAAEHVLVLTPHQIVADARSMEILVHELGVLYSDFCRGSVVPLPALTVQYPDGALEQRRQSHDNALACQLAYWKKALQDAPTLLELPTDCPHPAIQPYCGAMIEFALPTDLIQNVQSLAVQACVALATVLPSRYTGQNDICLGMPVANRPSKEAEALIGAFEDTLVLRTRLSGNPSFRRVLTQVQEAMHVAMQHHDLLFERLIEELQPECSLSYTPLFQVMVATQHSAICELQIPRLSLSPLIIDHTAAKFDLTLNIVESADVLRGTFLYNTDIFDEILLEDVVANPDTRIGQPLLRPEQRRKLIVDWSNTA